MKRLANLRKQKGLSQVELADKIGISQQTISKYERGLLEPDFGTLNFLADFFNVSIDDLLGRDVPSQHVNDEEALEFLDELHKRPEMKTLFQVGRKATKDDIETAITIIEALKKKGG
jgi:transcriptional regulator with XRE-family HTH domain